MLFLLAGILSVFLFMIFISTTESDESLCSSISLDKSINTGIVGEGKMIKSNNAMITVSHRKLTPAQIVANNTEILSLIFGYITNLNDRRNIELCCKKFYDVCNQSACPSFFSLEDKSNLCFSTFYGDGSIRIVIFGREMTLNIPKNFSFDCSNLSLLEKIFKKCLTRVDTLNIQNLSLGHVGFFKNLNCFEMIKEIKMNLLTLENGGNMILSKCSSLNPSKLIISEGSCHDSTFNNNNESTLPKSIETIQFDCSSKYFKWLLKGTETLKLRTFDNFIVHKPLSDLMKNPDEFEVYFDLVPYFKNISFQIDSFETFEYSEALNKILLENNIGSYVIYSPTERYLHKGKSYPLPETNSEENLYKQRLEDQTGRFLAQPGIYLSIRKLKILDFNEVGYDFPLMSVEVKVLKEDISRMNYLSLFEVCFYLLDESNFFEQICMSLDKVQTIRLQFCIGMKFGSLRSLSMYAKNLKHLSLVEIECEAITIRRILSHFKNLKSLEIIFGLSYDVFLILSDLMKTDNSTGSGTFNWYTLHYLNVICCRPNFEEKQLINQIERNTPRKSGQLLFRNILYHEVPRYQILARLSNKFGKFDNPLINGRFKLKKL